MFRSCRNFMYKDNRCFIYVCCSSFVKGQTENLSCWEEENSYMAHMQIRIARCETACSGHQLLLHQMSCSVIVLGKFIPL